jgi:hypothetical protein
MKTSTCRTILLILFAGMVVLTGESFAVPGKFWTASPGPEKPVITAPENDAVYQVNQEVEFTCTRMTDKDSWLDQSCQQGQEDDQLAAETSYPSWTASAGSWLGGDNKGATVTWVAPASPQAGITVDVTDDDLPTAVTSPDTGTRNDDPVDADQSTGVTVVEIVLTQDHDLWWFNGANASNYHEQVNLTVSGITEGTFVWTVTAGTDKVNFENDADTITTTDDNTVGLKSTAGSGALNDVTVTVKIDDTDNTAGGNVTVYTPQAEVQTGVTDHNFTYMGHNNGYDSRHNFQVRDQFGDVLPHNTELNEHWTEGAHNDHTPPTDWGQAAAQSWTADPSGDIDHLWACFWGTKVPNTTNPAGGNTPVCHWDGEHYVGTLTEGSGVRVFTRVWQYYEDHGRRQQEQ